MWKYSPKHFTKKMKDTFTIATNNFDEVIISEWQNFNIDSRHCSSNKGAGDTWSGTRPNYEFLLFHRKGIYCKLGITRRFPFNSFYTNTCTRNGYHLRTITRVTLKEAFFKKILFLRFRYIILVTYYY